MDYLYDVLKRAYNAYNESNIEYLEKSIYKSFMDIIDESKDELKKIIEANHEDISFEEIQKICEENDYDYSYKRTIRMAKDENNFIDAIYKVPIGIVYVEAQNVREVLNEILMGIKYRNETIIAVEKLNEYDLNSYLLLLVEKAFELYDLVCPIVILPYEECEEELADLRIYRFYKDEIQGKEKANSIAYLENNDFKNEAIKNGTKIITGDFLQALKEINQKQYDVAVVYTHDSKLGYKFINRVNANNVFVNTNVKNAIEIEKLDNMYLMPKHIIYGLA